MRGTKLACAIMLTVAAGCSRKPVLQCSSADATSTVVKLVKDELEKAVGKALSDDSGISQVGRSKIRATIQQLGIAIEDVRTSKEDPNSTKRFCTGKLAIRVPATVLDDAEATRSSTGMSNITAFADQSNVDREADKFSMTIDYDVQPTDDGDKVFAETEDTGRIDGFFGQIVSASLLKSSLEQTRIAQQQEQAAQTQQQEVALAEQKAADGAQAKTDNQLADQTISAVWRNLDPAVRAQALEDQRAWIRKKTADCNVEAAGASIDPTERETARLRCDTRMTQERIRELQGLPTAPADGNAM